MITFWHGKVKGSIYLFHRINIWKTSCKTIKQLPYFLYEIIIFSLSLFSWTLFKIFLNVHAKWVRKFIFSILLSYHHVSTIVATRLCRHYVTIVCCCFNYFMNRSLGLLIYLFFKNTCLVLNSAFFQKYGPLFSYLFSIRKQPRI